MKTNISPNKDALSNQKRNGKSSPWKGAVQTGDMILGQSGNASWCLDASWNAWRPYINIRKLISHFHKCLYSTSPPLQDRQGNQHLQASLPIDQRSHAGPQPSARCCLPSWPPWFLQSNQKCRLLEAPGRTLSARMEESSWLDWSQVHCSPCLGSILLWSHLNCISAAVHCPINS